MSGVKAGGPAFPFGQKVIERGYGLSPNVIEENESGISVRDYFAAKADVESSMGKLAVIDAEAIGIPLPASSSANDWLTWHFAAKAKLKYLEADAMLAARES
jgi:hypothetical protein